MEIRPITFRQASDYINQNHRHHKATVGCKYCIGLYDGENLIGCAVCGRPVSRYLDDGLTCEINRVCTDGTRNACSMLYGACCRVAKAMVRANLPELCVAKRTGNIMIREEDTGQLRLA